MADLPSGTVTFLFTDIEGSTHLWEQHPQAMPDALARHNAILRQVTAAHGGVVFRTVGDAFCTALASAPAALRAALAKSDTISAAVRAKALSGAGDLANNLSDFATARAYAEEGLAVLRALGDKTSIAFALWLLGFTLRSTGEYAMARACAEESLALFHEVSDKWGRPYPLALLVNIACVQGDLIQAAVYNQEFLTFYRQIGYKRGIAVGLIDKGVIAQLQSAIRIDVVAGLNPPRRPQGAQPHHCQLLSRQASPRYSTRWWFILASCSPYSALMAASPRVHRRQAHRIFRARP